MSESSGESVGYYGQRIVKAPVWTWEIPSYFFVGGVAGMACVIAWGAELAAERELARAGLWLAFAGCALSPLLLIRDLGRPARFLYMLRVFKPGSPMSVGVFVLVAYSTLIAAALALTEWTERAAAPAWVLPMRSGLLAPGALLGATLATYTGVLLGATAIPFWARHHRALPVHFGAASLGSAAALLELSGFASTPLAVLGVASASVETALTALLARGAGPPRARLVIAGLLMGPVALLLRAVGLAPLASASFIAGSLASRFAWLAAGRS